jgi:hypothetical protein
MVEGTRYRLYFARQYGLLSGLVEKLWEMSKVKPYGPLIKSEPKGVAQVIEGMQEPSHSSRHRPRMWERRDSRPVASSWLRVGRALPVSALLHWGPGAN